MDHEEGNRISTQNHFYLLHVVTLWDLQSTGLSSKCRDSLRFELRLGAGFDNSAGAGIELYSVRGDTATYQFV